MEHVGYWAHLDRLIHYFFQLELEFKAQSTLKSQIEPLS